MSILFNNTDNFQAVKADSNIETIGVYYEVERVEERTRVTVTGEDIDIAIEAGRDLVLVSGPIFPPGGPVRPLSYGDLYVSGYYYATPEDGRIIARHELRNDLQSLVTMIRIVQNEVDSFDLKYNKNYSNNSKNNLILTYLRSFNTDYISDTYGMVAGTHADLASLIIYINSLSTGGMEIREYFASFLGSKYNGAFGEIADEYNQLNLDLYAYENAPIDLIHLFASFDIICENTNTNNTYIWASKNVYNYVGSWAGDLQTFCVYLSENNYTNFNLISDGFLKNNSTFPYCDLYADLIAINLGTLLNLNDPIDFASYIDNYFLSNNVISSTFRTFVQKILLTYGGKLSESNEYRMKECIFEMLDMKYNGESTQPNSSFGGDSINRYIKYKYLTTQEGIPNFELRRSLAEQFYSYIENNGGFINA